MIGTGWLSQSCALLVPQVFTYTPGSVPVTGRHLPLRELSRVPVEVHFQKSERLDEHGAPAMALLVSFSTTQALPRSALLSWNQVALAPGLLAAVAEPTVTARPV